MINKNTWLLFSAIVLIFLLATGCSNSEGSQPEGQGEQGEVTLQVWTRVGGSYKELFEETIAEFGKQHPNIKLEVNEVPPGEVTASFQAAATANELPDLFQNAGIPLQQKVELDLLHPLDDVVGELKDQFIPGMWTEGQSTLDGKIYGIPNHEPRGHIAVLFYNKTLLSNAGYTEELPKRMTWDDLREMSKASIEANPGTYGITLSVPSGWISSTVLRSMAVAIAPELSMGYTDSTPWNYKVGDFVYNDPGLIEAFQFFKMLQDEGLLHPNVMEDDSNAQRQVFFDGEAAFSMQISEGVNAFFENDDNQDTGVTYMPTKDGLPYYSPYAGNVNVNWEVSKNTEHFEEVKTFLKFLMDYQYPLLVERGVVASPIVDINQSVTSESELFKKVSEMMDETTVVVPRPVDNNQNTVDVITEFHSNAPSVGWADIFKGYMTGQVTDLEGEMEKADQEFHKVFAEAINEVNAKGKEVSQEDFTFPDWVPFQNYIK